MNSLFVMLLNYKSIDLKLNLILLIILILFYILYKYANKNKKIYKFLEDFSRLSHFWIYNKTICTIFIFIVFMIVVLVFDNLFILKYRESNVKSIQYNNDHQYKNYHQIEYIGGQKVCDSSVGNIKRWYPIYIDINTKEILRGGNTENYINAGYCKVGIDKTYILEERDTKKNFIKYILDYTGGILFDDNSLDLPNDYYGVNYANEDYNKPIDIVVDYNWNINKEYTSNDKYLIGTISNVENYSINSTLLESDGKLTENEYIYNILRNCFGYISDDFYDLSNNKINFSEINITEVRIGDIGCFYDRNHQACFGMCIGYDKSKNPIFTICTSSNKINNKALEKYSNSIKKQSGIDKEIEIGFNVLFVEKINRLRFFGTKNVFEKYYHTNLPFRDDNTISDNKNFNYIIENIDIYNDQVYYKKLLKQGKWKGIDLSDMIYQERIKRIANREKIAQELVDKYKIDLLKYDNIDIQELNSIYDLNTYEYIKKYIDNDINKYAKLSSKEYKQKQKKEEDETRKRIFIDSLERYKLEMKSKSVEDIMKQYEERNKIILSETGKQIIIDYYNEIHNN